MAQSEGSPAEAWYVVKQADGHCDIMAAAAIDSPADQSAQSDPSDVSADSSQADSSQEVQQWGPFSSQAEAIARRVGLIRAGKCQPI